MLLVSMLAALISSTGIARADAFPICVGTRFFESAQIGTIFNVGDTWHGGTFTFIENGNIVRTVEESADIGQVVVGEFKQPRRLGDLATIQFNRQIRITTILWYDNDPKVPPEVPTAEDGWSFNGIAGPITANSGTAISHVNLTTNTVTISAGDDSGGVDFCFEEITGTQGCTPGYWKQSQHFDSWVGYTPTQLVSSVFSGVDPSLASKTLQQTLDGGGGPGIVGAQKILLRAAVAALLNAANSNVDYPRTTAQIIADVNAALASNNRDTMLTLATALDKDNNLGCPLN
jgi:hypothetical protein